MKISGKISAFTLIEVIIVSIISAIIVILIYDIFLQLKRSWIPFYNQQEKVTSLLFFKKTFENDIDRCAFIKTADEKTFYLVSSADTICYYFDSVVLRTKNNHTDTFSMSVNNVRPTYVPDLSQDGIVRDITVDIKAPLMITNATFNKYYASSDLLFLNL
ncbi:MAG TPA: hypothetical protein VHA52_06370 [Candidatus Babeliaceae bacterium]|nr:hypothetical protein [Candidatus Babeliaceae bacterium]